MAKRRKVLVRPARHQKPFTAEDDQAIRDGAAQGLFYRHVADALQRTDASIENRAKVLGVKFDSVEKRKLAGFMATQVRDPAKHSRGMSEKAWTPERRAKHAERMRRLYLEGRNGNIGRKGAKRSPETVERIRAGVARSYALGKKPTTASWLPAHKKGRYEYLRSRLGPEAAKERVMAEVRAEAAAAAAAAQAAEAARLAALTPFERQLERARKFGIVERPRMVANDLTFSPVGSCLA